MKIDMPNGAKAIIKILKAHDKKAYIVGGCVRDSLIGKKPKDWDICTSATPEEVKDIFFDTIDTGIKHGTVTVKMQDGLYEVTTFRVDGKYSDSRRPDSVKFVDDIRLDLSRRDFTINAMAYNDEEGLIDPFNGEADLEEFWVVRCVGNPDDRFTEDPLRIMRAIRFACAYGLDIETKTLQSLKQNRKAITNVSAERINAELRQILVKPNADVLRDTWLVFNQILPKFYANICSINTWIFDICCANGDLVVALCAMLKDFSNYVQILKSLRFENTIIKSVKNILDNADNCINSKYELKKLIRKIGFDDACKFLCFHRAVEDGSFMYNEYHHRLNAKIDDRNFMWYKSIVDGNETCQISDLKIDGETMKGFGLEGKEVGVALNRVLDGVLFGFVEDSYEKQTKYANYVANCIKEHRS